MAAALVVRWALVGMLWTEETGPVAYEHGAIAENLLAGRGFSIWFLGTEGPTSQQAPFYPFALAGLYALFDKSTAHLLMQLVQSVVGAGLVGVVFWLARRVLPKLPSAAWTAAIGAAIFPPHIYMVTHLQVAVWAAFGVTLLFALVAEPRVRQQAWGSCWAGLTAGGLLLIDPILALALPWAWLMWLRGVAADQAISRWEVARRAVMMPAVAWVLVMPWLVRNYVVHGEFVFVKSTFGYALWQGNNPLSWGTDKIPKSSSQTLLHQHDGTLAGRNQALWAARHETLYIDDVLLKPGGFQQFAGLTEPQRSRLLEQEAYSFIHDQPQRYAELCLQRLRYFLLFDETNPKTQHPWYRASTIIWFVLSLVGLLAGGPHARRLWPIYGACFTLTLFHSLTIVSARFRIPLEPLTFLWCSLTLGPPLSRLTTAWREARTPIPAEDDTPTLSVPHLRKSSRRASRERRAA